MNTKYLEKLEYYKILNNISNYSITYLGKDSVLKMAPCTIKNTVKNLLNETLEATTLIYRKGNLPIVPIANNDFSIKLIESSSSISISGLLELNLLLKLAKDLKHYYENDSELNFNVLSIYFDNLYTNNEIFNTISNSIIDETTIADDASPILRDIRKKQKNIDNQIKDKLNNFIHSSTYSKYIQEPIVTIKNNRYVIPVKQEYRSFVKGFVHDISSSGSTVFIEPISIFDLNNDINTLKLEESIEIEKILMKLSSLFFPIVEQLKSNIEIIGSLDLIFAKAKYSISIDGTLPVLTDSKQIDLISIRHPLIEKDKVVPIDISIGNNFSTLVITGPNTGGKTVSIKTVGLTLLMAYSGILIPAKENSLIYVFDNIFCDIGDEQSIAESVSTFSAHILNIIEITKKVSDNSLVILDELGSGTDPIEGSALAISILEYFCSKHCLTIATTHYKEVKDFTLLQDGFNNASFEFDLVNLKPTYKLLMGIPGKSNAFEISTKLGLNKEILDNATKYLNSENINVEDLLKKIYDDKILIEQEKENILKNSNQIEILRKQLENEKETIEAKKNKLLEQSKLEARQILLSAKEQLTGALSDLNNSNVINKKRNEINNKLKELNTFNYSTASTKTDSTFNKDDIVTGMSVFVEKFGKNGTIISLPNNSNEVLVQVGNIKINLHLSALSIEKKSSVPKSTKTNISKSQTISNEINIIGLNVDEAVPIVDKYLDDAYISSLTSVRIIHGKGTGALRKGIHAFLKTHSHVKDYRIGTFGEGEMGATVVNIK